MGNLSERWVGFVCLLTGAMVSTTLIYQVVAKNLLNKVLTDQNYAVWERIICSFAFIAFILIGFQLIVFSFEYFKLRKEKQSRLFVGFLLLSFGLLCGIGGFTINENVFIRALSLFIFSGFGAMFFINEQNNE